MLKVIALCLVFSQNVMAETPAKPDPSSPINAQEQINGLPGGSAGKAYSVKTKKRVIRSTVIGAPVENTTPANCADSLGGKGMNNYTECQATKK